jgi:isopenicillin N synthase-like dioxygenase
MHSSFDDIPPFPNNLPLAPIAIISHAKLLEGDHDEAVRLLTAAKTHGFWYLKLQDTPQGKAFLAEADQLHAVAKEAFALPLHEKLPHALERGVSLFGYKPAGTVKTTDRDQRPDTTQFFNVSKDYVHDIARDNIRGTPITYPPEITTHTPLFQSFTSHGHACGMLILRTLASQLGLPEDSFTNLNLFDHPSGDHCRLTHKPPSPPSPDGGVSCPSSLGLPSHTDFGSVTVLFNWLGGLQVESHIDTTTKSSEGGERGEVQREWEWVKPLPGHAIVNLGTVYPAPLPLFSTPPPLPAP